MNNAKTLPLTAVGAVGCLGGAGYEGLQRRVSSGSLYVLSLKCGVNHSRPIASGRSKLRKVQSSHLVAQTNEVWRVTGTPRRAPAK